MWFPFLNRERSPDSREAWFQKLSLVPEAEEEKEVRGGRKNSLGSRGFTIVVGYFYGLGIHPCPLHCLHNSLSFTPGREGSSHDRKNEKVTTFGMAWSRSARSLRSSTACCTSVRRARGGGAASPPAPDRPARQPDPRQLPSLLWRRRFGDAPGASA